MNKISVVIITKNEEEVIKGCLESVKWVDEIIIVDCASMDNTLKIAQKYTKNIFIHKWEGFAKQKNYAISKAKNDWILTIDADERLSRKLQNEIKILMTADIPIAAYRFRRLNIFLGRLMKNGGWNPDFQIKLFKKGSAHFDENRRLHEELIVKGNVEDLHFPLYHLSHRSVESNLLKTHHYALLASDELKEKDSPKVTKTSLLKGILGQFFNRYIRAKGYKDGMEGFIEAVYQAFSQEFIIQSILWEKQNKKSMKEKYREIDERIELDTYER